MTTTARRVFELGCGLLLVGCGPALEPPRGPLDATRADAATVDAGGWLDAALPMPTIADPCPATVDALTLRARAQQRGVALVEDAVVGATSAAPSVVTVQVIDGQALLQAQAPGSAILSLQGAAGARALAVDVQLRPSPFATRVVEVVYGEGAGYGQAELPGVVLGPPTGAGSAAGSLDVLALGAGGHIVLELGVDVVDGPGPDLLVFENPFVDPLSGALAYPEPAELAVSMDGERWSVFACDPEPPWTGCAGLQPVHGNPARGVDPLDPTRAGGDAFDLADLGLARVRFVRLRDVSAGPPGGRAVGFDLDAVAALHALPRWPRVELRGPGSQRLGPGAAQPLRFDVVGAGLRWRGVAVACVADDPAVVAVDCACTATALRAGRTRVRARLGDREAAVEVEVTP